MTTQNIDIENPDGELRDSLIRIGRLRVVVRCLTSVVYAAVLCWIAWCICSSFWGWREGCVQSESTWIYIAGAFVAFLVLHYLLMYGLVMLTERENRIMRKAVRCRFPDAVYSANVAVPRTTLGESALFELFPEEDAVDVTSYGSITFRGDEGSTTIYDIGVTSGRVTGILNRLPVVGYVVMIYRLIVRPIFGAPVESTMHGFRGMFGTHTGSRACKGRVILLPDKLEGKIGYLAHSVQSCRSRNGARHMVLEDAEFENLFAVYADDEVEARKVLTPAAMRHITNLCRLFGKELLISFSGNRIYYAVPFAGGFLRPSRKSLNDIKVFDRIFYEIDLARQLCDPGSGA